MKPRMLSKNLTREKSVLRTLEFSSQSRWIGETVKTKIKEATVEKEKIEEAGETTIDEDPILEEDSKMKAMDLREEEEVAEEEEEEAGSEIMEEMKTDRVVEDREGQWSVTNVKVKATFRRTVLMKRTEIREIKGEQNQESQNKQEWKRCLKIKITETVNLIRII